MNRVSQNVMLNLVDEIAISLTSVENGHARDALASLYELRLMLVAEGMINGDHSALPRMIDPVTRQPKPMRVKTFDVPCPTCLAKPKHPCMRMTRRGALAEPTDVPLQDGDKRMFHKSRTAIAKARSAA